MDSDRRRAKSCVGLFVAAAIWAFAFSPRAEPQSPAPAQRSGNDRPVEIQLEGLAELERLLEQIPIASFHREQLRPSRGGGLTFTPRVTPEELRALRRAGFRPHEIDDELRAARVAMEAAWESRAGGAKRTVFSFPLATYPSHAEIGDIFADIASAHPTLARTFSWGSSAQGRELWGLVISDDAHATEAEPEVRLSSTIHGDEVVGMVMLLDLAEYLTTHYGQPGFEEVTALVDATEIHILPLHNPDGYVTGQRRNSNFVDLNRNFPEPAGTDPARQIENLRFMEHALAQHFVISLNGHGGALVVNYPWDYTTTRAPDDAALIRLSLEYSTTNLPMYNGSFSQGITNGADWYVITGSLQDWSYDQTGCIDVTLEISDQKTPLPSTLPDFWNDNRQSLLDYVASARYGIHGVVAAEGTAEPLDAVVTVAGNSMPVFTDPDHGDYYKLLDDGTYDLTFEAQGYQVRTITGIMTTWGTPTRLDVTLQPEPVDSPGAAGFRTRIVRLAPNPFNPATQIHFELAANGLADVEVFNLRGRTVRTLHRRALPPGPHRIEWDGRSDDGAPVASGVYLVRLRAEGAESKAKAVLVR